MVKAYCPTYQIPLVMVNANGGIDRNSFFGQSQLILRIMGAEDRDLTWQKWRR